MKISDSIKNSGICQKVRESEIYKKITYDYTMEDIVGEEKFEKMKSRNSYKFISDWAGLATNKVVLGVYMGAKTGLLPGTSALARAISLGVHSSTSPFYSKLRDFVYKKGGVTTDASKIKRVGAELLAFNLGQTTIYTLQIAAAMGIHSVLDADVDFDTSKIASGAMKFAINSWWLAPVGKWSMDKFRTFFGAKTPEQLVDQQKKSSLEERV
jgi:hypothetical protein